MKQPRRFRPLRAIFWTTLILVICFGAGLWAYNRFAPTNPMVTGRPQIKALAPLAPVTRTSVVVAPVAIALLAIRDAIEAQAPRNASGTDTNPYSDQLGRSEISWTAARGPLQVVGQASGIDISTSVNGTARLTGETTNSKDNITNKLSSMLGGNLGREAQKFATRMLDQSADIRATVSINARPALLPNWRIEPNLTGQVALGDVNFAGIKINASNDIKPTLDKAVAEQMAVLSNHLRNDPVLETTVRAEWGKMCRSVALGKATPQAPALWLEVRPTKAIAGQPRIVQDWIILTVGVQAETRIVPTETKPECPFPARLDIMPQLDQAKVAVAVPIDVPISELNRVMEEQLINRTFPDDPNAAGQITVLAATLAASGDRLLISMRVKARETKSWFGFGTEATVHVWGKPTLDQSGQLLRLSDMSLDVESEAAFGLLGTAARAAIPFLQTALAKYAVIDLKPFADNARTSIETALKDVSRPTDGVEIEAGITGLRLTSIEFDSKTLRVIGEAQGTARALVRKITVP